ncbi:MAG: hypothetical protein IKU14_07265, partial [Rhodocyclaceae bacterium]|nr:hypothetical protein [Rhodocyclaceae bacterium]
FAVSSNGEPIVLKSGSPKSGFTVFDNTRGLNTTQAPKGTAWFSDETATAASYSGTTRAAVMLGDYYDSREAEPGNYSCFLNIRDPFEAWFEGANWDGVAYGKVRLVQANGVTLWDEDDVPVLDEDGMVIIFDDEQDARNYAEAHDMEDYAIKDDDIEPIYDDDGIELIFDSAREAEEYAKAHGITNWDLEHDPIVDADTNAVVREAMELGHDGVIIHNVVDRGPKERDAGMEVDESTVYVVFNSNQIKSATHNLGLFSDRNDIRLKLSKDEQAAQMSLDFGEPEAHALPSVEDDAYATVLNHTLAHQFNNPDWRNAYTAAPLPEGMAALRADFEAAFGRTICPVLPTDDRFNAFGGVYLTDHPGKVFVNVRRARNIGFLQLAGHELLHDIKRDRPDLYHWFITQADSYLANVEDYRQRLNALALEKNVAPYSLQAAKEELIADFTGDALGDTKFLGQLAKSDKDRFTGLMQSVGAWFKKVGDKLRGKGMESAQHVKDVDGLRNHLSDVLIAYVNGKKIEELPGYQTKRQEAPEGAQQVQRRATCTPALREEGDAKAWGLTVVDRWGNRYKGVGAALAWNQEEAFEAAAAIERGDHAALERYGVTIFGDDTDDVLEVCRWRQDDADGGGDVWRIRQNGKLLFGEDWKFAAREEATHKVRELMGQHHWNNMTQQARVGLLHALYENDMTLEEKIQTSRLAAESVEPSTLQLIGATYSPRVTDEQRNNGRVAEVGARLLQEHQQQQEEKVNRDEESGQDERADGKAQPVAAGGDAASELSGQADGRPGRENGDGARSGAQSDAGGQPTDSAIETPRAQQAGHGSVPADDAGSAGATAQATGTTGAGTEGLAADGADAEPGVDQQADMLGGSNNGRLEDFGEKLGRARKDLAASLAKEYSTDDIARMSLSEIWPKEDVNAIENTTLAAIAHASRAALPNRPKRSYAVAEWAHNVKKLRDMVCKVVSGETSEYEFFETLRSGGWRGDFGRDLADKIGVLKDMPREYWQYVKETRNTWRSLRGVREDGSYGIVGSATYFLATVKVGKKSGDFDVKWSDDGYDGERRDILFAMANKIRAALDYHFRQQQEKDDEQPEAKFEVVLYHEWDRNLGTNVLYTFKKGDSLKRRLKTWDVPDGTTARKYAQEVVFPWINEHRDELAAAWEEVKERDNVGKADVRGAENRIREGKDWRKGADATPEMFMDAFGFRGVEFGKWVKQGKDTKERQWMLNQAYDAFHDLADVLGVPPKAMSLNGSLGLGFGSRGRGGRAAAHFEPDLVVINLTKTQGAGSLAHEWFHALDNYFSRMREGREHEFITNKPEADYFVLKGTLAERWPGLANMSISRARLESKRSIYPDEEVWNPENWVAERGHPEGVRYEMEAAFGKLVKALD